MISTEFTVVYKSGKKFSFDVVACSYEVLFDIQSSFLHDPNVDIAYFLGVRVQKHA